MYCKCHCAYEAKQLFSEMTYKNTITWNTLIAGFEALDSRESLCIFSRMVSEGFGPDCFSFTSALGACANLAVLYCGPQLHGVIVHRGLNNNLEISNALIYMYAKCGNIADSHKIFSEMPCTNLISWTSMMIGYGDHGYGEEAVELFNEMIRSSIKPDRMAFMAVLSACSHARLVDEGLRYFRLMISYYNIAPDIEIYGCVVDLLGRAGRVEEAYHLIKSMPFKPDESIWAALLGACKVHKQQNVAKLAALRALDMKPNRAGTYALLSDIYAAEGNWADFASSTKLRGSIKNNSDSGRSWIELKDQVCTFVVGDRYACSNEQMCEVLKLLIVHMKDVDMCLI